MVSLLGGIIIIWYYVSMVLCLYGIIIIVTVIVSLWYYDCIVAITIAESLSCCYGVAVAIA